MSSESKQRGKLSRSLSRLNPGNWRTSSGSSSRSSSPSAIPRKACVDGYQSPDSSATGLTYQLIEEHVVEVSTPSWLQTLKTVSMDGTVELLDIARQSSNWNPIAQSVLGAVVALIELGKTVKSNWKEMESLVERIEYLLPILNGRLKSDKISESGMRRHLEKCVKTLQLQAAAVIEMHNHGLLRRILQGTEDAERLLSMYMTLKDSLDDLQCALGIAIERNTNEILKQVVLQSLAVSKIAAHNAAVPNFGFLRRECTEGTRVEITESLIEWATGTDVAPVFWLTGPAGMGKTTIAQTICKRLERPESSQEQYLQRPLISFFCSRQLEDSRDSTHFVPTLCRRLAEYSSSYAHELVDVLTQRSALANAVIDIQFEELLVQPWQRSLEHRSGLTLPVFIIDALDENEAGYLFLKLLLKAKRDLKLLGLRFLVTSRMNQEIVELCNSFVDPESICRLQDIPEGTVERDIALYLKESLPLLKDSAILGSLIQASHGLFIYAATVVKLVAPAEGRAANMQINVERYAVGSLEDDDVKQGRLTILHTILCLKQVGSVNVICHLIGTEEENVSLLVKNLHAVMYIADDGTIRTYHASFADSILRLPFSMDSALTADILCDVGRQEAYLALKCHRIIKEQLHFNMCSLQSSFALDKDIPDLQSRVEAKVDPTLQYAVLYWCAHLEASRLSQSETNTESSTLSEIPQVFVDNLLIFWLEVINLTGNKTAALRRFSSERLHHWIGKYASPVLSIWKEAIRFCSAFSSGASSGSTPQLYLSTLATWDPGSHIYKVWQPRFPHIPKVSAHHFRATSVVIPVKGLRCLALSPNGEWSISGSQDCSVSLWDLSSGEQMKGFNGQQDSTFMSVTISPNGQYAASASCHDPIRMWDIGSGNQLHTLNAGWVCSIMFSPDSCQIVSGGADGTILLWDTTTGQQLTQLKGHRLTDTDTSPWIECLAFSPDGRYIIGGSTCHDHSSSSLYQWDVKSGHQCRMLKDNLTRLSCVAFSPDGRRLAVGDWKGSITSWNLNTNDLDCLFESKLHTSVVRSLSFSPNGQLIVSGGGDCIVHVSESYTGHVQKSLHGHQEDVVSVSFHPDGQRIVSGSRDSSIQVWDISQADEHDKLPGHQHWVNIVVFSPDGQRIFSGGYEGCMFIWDAVRGRQQNQLVTGNDQDKIVHAAFSPDGKKIAILSRHICIYIWDAIGGNQLKAIDIRQYSLWRVAFLPDGLQVISAGSSYAWKSHTTVPYMALWDSASGELLKEWGAAPYGSNLCIAFSPDCRQFASIRETSTANLEGGSLFLWDVDSGSQLKELIGHKGKVHCASFSPDGHCVISGSDDHSICMWDVASGELLKKFIGLYAPIMSIAFSFDGRKIVSGSTSCIAIWDTVTSKALKLMRGHDSTVTTVAFSVDGQKIVSGGRDRSVRVWNATIDVKDNSSDEFRWDIDIDSGWVLSEKNERLMWLSPMMKRALYTPNTLLIMSTTDATHLPVFRRRYMGSKWTSISVHA
ncbi:hypothetical protein BDP27DRAFT_1420914 [Rhodocollybia butyracea]|uniref:NACHT domain-containing protein n=1 Tax=Rhodocollybia butyracea TaxID=206335 RepID=A0A9P5U821_9AGAR|nr:hypothetical protein BDP27DRAFT_1420914 [Rhodocollybia butyracea]